MLLAETFEELNYADSTTTKLSDILPESGKRFRFEYEYDFGDGWLHEVLFEGRLRAEPGKRYPLCLEGARACPPEDVGGVWGYVDFLEAIADPKNEQHEEMLEWIGRQVRPRGVQPGGCDQEDEAGAAGLAVDAVKAGDGFREAVDGIPPDQTIKDSARLQLLTEPYTTRRLDGPDPAAIS